MSIVLFIGAFLWMVLITVFGPFNTVSPDSVLTVSSAVAFGVEIFAPVSAAVPWFGAAIALLFGVPK